MTIFGTLFLTLFGTIFCASSNNLSILHEQQLAKHGLLDFGQLVTTLVLPLADFFTLVHPLAGFFTLVLPLQIFLPWFSLWQRNYLVGGKHLLVGQLLP